MLILGVGCILEGCRKESNHSVTITLIHAWGGTEEDHVAMREIYEEFQEENPDINLQMISMPTREDMMRKVEDMIMVGNIPDIVSFSGTGKNSTYDFMIENNMALDIYPYMQQDQEFADSVSEVNKQYWSTETGELYSVADALMLSGGYWYNEDILKAAGIEKVPKSWDEFQTMCEQISEWALNEKNEVKALQPTAEGYLYCMDHMLAGSEDSRFEGHNLIFQDEIFNNAINRMKRMYNSAISENAEYSYRDETHLFNEGKLAIYINGVWGAPMISKQIDAKYALLPTDGGESMSCISSGLGYVLGNSGNEEKEKAKTIESGDLKLDCESRRVFIAGKEINLTAKEFDVLELLVFNPNKVYSRENLLNIVWGYEYPGDVRTVDVHIRRLREKIEANPSEPKYVHTKWGVGYYFQA